MVIWWEIVYMVYTGVITVFVYLFLFQIKNNGIIETQHQEIKFLKGEIQKLKVRMIFVGVIPCIKKLTIDINISE